jgi:hypothetical protein
MEAFNEEAGRRRTTIPSGKAGQNLVGQTESRSGTVQRHEGNDFGRPAAARGKSLAKVSRCDLTADSKKALFPGPSQ